MTRATLGHSRFAARFTIERLRNLLLIGGVLLVAAIGIFLAAGQWKLRKALKDIPGRLGINIEQQADGVNYTQTRKGKTIFKIHAARAITRKTGGTTELHDVRIDLYGDDGNRADTIAGSEFEYDPASGVASAAGSVEITMMRPGVRPAISQLHPGMPKAQPRAASKGKSSAVSGVLGAITDDEIHVKTSGLIFNQKTGLATTSQRVDFALRQGSGNSIGATYNSEHGQLILDRAVELQIERSGANEGPVTVHASHAEFARDEMACTLLRAQAQYTGGTAMAEHALLHFREDGSVARMDGSNGVDLQTVSGSHVTAPVGSVDFDSANHPRHGLLQDGVQLQVSQPNRQIRGTSQSAQLTFDAEGRLSLAHLEQNVVFNSQQQTTAASGVESQVRRTWNSRTADIVFAPAASSAAGKEPVTQSASQQKVEPRTIRGYGGVVVSSQTVTDGVAVPSRLAADTVVAELAPGAALTSLHGSGHASFDERNAKGVHQSSTADQLDVRFVPASPSKAKGASGKSEIASVVEAGHVILTQDALAAAQPGGSPREPIRAMADRADYDGSTEILHLTGSPRVHDGALEMTAVVIDFARASGDAFAHGDVRASWTGSGASSGTVPGAALLAGGSAGGEGPIHAVAAEAELHQSTQDIVFRGMGKGPDAAQPRLWQSANSVSAPFITLNRLKQTLVAESSGAAAPVRTVLVSNGGIGSGKAANAGTGKPAKDAPSVIRIRSGDLHYSEGERVAFFHAGQAGAVTAETTGSDGSSTIVSQQAEVTLFPAGVHGSPERGRTSNSSIDRLTAQGHVAIDWPGRRGTGEKLVYRSQDGTYTLTGTGGSPPRVSDEVRGTVTGSALILHSGDDRVTVEGDGGKTVTETRSKK